MKITIEIPKEFESDYTEDRFADYFNRVKADTRHDYSHGMCGNYEAEITNMFIEAFSKAEESVSDDFTDDLLNQGYTKGYYNALVDIWNKFLKYEEFVSLEDSEQIIDELRKGCK